MTTVKRVVVTGGAGFIGSALIRHLLAQPQYQVLNLDKLTYAGNLDSLGEVSGNPRYRFAKVDICDAWRVRRTLADFQPHVIVHLAAESHVDRSIEGPEAFVRTNVVGTCTLLAEAQRFVQGLPSADQEAFRFHHVSTDEVFGELGAEGRFTEDSAYRPNSPYAASKASADHFVRAWSRTFGLPVVVSNCSNNYGPYHFPEKLIPLMILKGVREEALPVYGKGTQIRDWLYVEDHARALQAIFEHGKPGESYNIGGDAELNNLDVVNGVCTLLDKLHPRAGGRKHAELISYVADRPGHDFRYAMDYSKLESQLGWKPQETFASGLEKTVRWYLTNAWWWTPILERTYAGQRLGVAGNVRMAG